MECLNSNSGELPAPVFSIGSCVGTLHQNNRVVREEGLADLVAALEGFVSADDLRYDRPEYEQAVDRCFYFLRSGSAKERKDAYRAIGLYALTVGSKAETLILDRLLDADHLPGMVPSSPSDAERAVAAIRCLAAATLACAKRPAEAKRPLKALWEVMEEAEAANIPRVLAAAMSAWTVVLPAVRDIGGGMTPFALISKLLGADDPAVRMAAGEALAVCVELNILPRQPQPPRWRYDKRAESKPGDRPLLESRVSELAFDEKHAQKNEHAEEMSLFRQIDDLLKKNKQQIEDLDKKKNNERPDESDGPCVKVPKRWAKLVQLNFLKQYMGEGFDTHYNLNLPLFRDSLGLTGAAGGAEEEDLPAHEKKQLRKDRDRQMSLAVKRDRQNKTKQYD